MTDVDDVVSLQQIDVPLQLLQFGLDPLLAVLLGDVVDDDGQAQELVLERLPVLLQSRDHLLSLRLAEMIKFKIDNIFILEVPKWTNKVLNLFKNKETNIQDKLYQIFICKTQFHLLRDLQFQFKFEKYGVKQNMENIIKWDKTICLIDKNSLND